jgi:hypothetical protein
MMLGDVSSDHFEPFIIGPTNNLLPWMILTLGGFILIRLSLFVYRLWNLVRDVNKAEKEFREEGGVDNER